MIRPAPNVGYATLYPHAGHRHSSGTGRLPGDRGPPGTMATPTGTDAPRPWRYGVALAPFSALATLRGCAGTATVGGALCGKRTKSAPPLPTLYLFAFAR